MDQDDTPPDLSLVETDHLRREFFKRFDAVVLVTLQDRGPDEKIVIWQHGGTTAALGLVKQAAMLFEDDARELDEDE